VDAEERALDQLLRTRLPRPAAPAALKQKIRAQLAGATPPARLPPPPRRARQLWAASFALAACAALFVLWPRPGTDAALERELVNDHLRVLYAQQPLEVASGGIHQVKPWFSGRVDFAPDVGFSGDDEFPLRGGAVGYLLDRKTATFVFQRRLHTITLLVFRAEGLALPSSSQAGPQLREAHGFHLLVWQAHGLGHALISDASAAELRKLYQKLDAGE
jgi:anti-sigma factor RsiW